jgi:hypothetical protein
MPLEAAKPQHTALPSEPTKHGNGRMRHPGQSGNPNGRPVGSRAVFGQAYLKDLAEVWSEEGRETMVNTEGKQLGRPRLAPESKDES